MAPDYLRQSISVVPPSKYDLRRNHDSGILLATPKARKKITLGDRSFSCTAPRLWNLLPSTMRSISSLNLFKNRLKTSLFSKAFINNSQQNKFRLHFPSLINFLCNAQLNIFMETARYKFLSIITLFLL